MPPVRILLQTTIEPIEDDWHIGRFSLLRDYLAAARGQDGAPLFEVTARDRAAPPGQPDPVLAALDDSDFDEIWLFAVDAGDGVSADECAAISRFRKRGRGVMVTRDHMDLGSSVCNLGGLGKAHHFHTQNPNPDPARQAVDDVETTYISWPNYHSGANGDFQVIRPEGGLHPVLRNRDGSALTLMPAHPHEGDVSAPADEPSARVIATGRSRATGRDFNIAVAFEPQEDAGPGLAQSTFHHFCDYNWDPRMGCPSFVSEPPGDTMLTAPEARRQAERYVLNLALWLAGRGTSAG
jgi:hypothetical protein